MFAIFKHFPSFYPLHFHSLPLPSPIIPFSECTLSLRCTFLPYQCKKTSQFIPQCKGDISHAFKTAKIMMCKSPDVPLQDELMCWSFVANVICGQLELPLLKVGWFSVVWFMVAARLVMIFAVLKAWLMSPLHCGINWEVFYIDFLFIMIGKCSAIPIYLHALHAVHVKTSEPSRQN